jgi:hypothetical protein
MRDCSVVLDKVRDEHWTLESISVGYQLITQNDDPVPELLTQSSRDPSISSDPIVLGAESDGCDQIGWESPTD